MRWQNHLRSLIGHFGRRVEQSLAGNGGVPCVQKQSFYSMGDSGAFKLPITRIARPFHQYLQQLTISTTRTALADAVPVRSPLTPLLGPGEGKTETQAAQSKPENVQAVLKGIKMSPKKLNLVAAVVRGMRVEDALLQMQVTVKRAAKTVYQVIHSARANATHNYGFDPERLLVAEAFVGKGLFRKRLSYHAKGRCGVKVRPECRLTVVVREITPEEEAEIARLRVSNFKKLTKRERRLIPHKLIESNPVWGRKNRPSSISRSQISLA